MCQRKVICLDDSRTILSVVGRLCQEVNEEYLPCACQLTDETSEGIVLEYTGVQDWSDPTVVSLTRPKERESLLFISDFNLGVVQGDLVLKNIARANPWITIILISSENVATKLDEIRKGLPQERHPAMTFIPKQALKDSLTEALRRFRLTCAI